MTPVIGTGVGRTALMVAAARAIEASRPDALVVDGYAEHFVRAAPVSAGWPLRVQDVPDGEANPLWGRLGRYFGVRTRAFDDFLRASVRAGARQVVLLGAGLDARAWRLDWPAAVVVFELDQAEVLAFKHAVLSGMGVTSAVPCRPIPVDLRTDWTADLLAAGFDPAVTTAWMAEGLLLYLPGAAERHLIDSVGRLSAGGSSLVYEVKFGPERPEVRASPIYTATRAQIDVDLLALFDAEPRPDSAAALVRRGWSVTVRTPFDLAREFGRGPRPEPADALAANRWVFATR